MEILPAAAPATPSELEEKLLDIGRYGFLDPVYVSVADNLLLVSDDLQYRVIARELHGGEGAWLQAVLIVAHGARVLDHKGYAEAVAGLAAQKHSHVTLNAHTLIQIVLQDASATLTKLEAAVGFIGNETADLDTHVKVVWEFLTQLWNTDLPYLRRAKATSIVLERLVGMLARFGVIKEVYLYLIRSSRRQPSLRDYLVSWARGHFLDVGV